MNSLVIDHIGARGDGVAYQADGQAVYVPRSAAGDHVRVDVTKGKDGALRGTLRDVLVPSPDRRDAPCQYYQHCGGCQLQHIKEGPYQFYKYELVREALRRVDVPVEEEKGAVFIPAGTRRRATFAAIMQRGVLQVGFHQQRSHNITHVNECLLLTPALLKFKAGTAEFLPEILRENVHTDISIQHVGDQFEIVFTGPLGKNGDPDAAQISAMAAMAEEMNIARIGWRMKDFDRCESVITRFPIMKYFGSVSVPIPLGAFLQPSEEGERALVSIVMENMVPGNRAIDLFSGCGTFSGPLLAKFKAVHAVEGNPVAVKAIEAAHIGGLTAQRRDLFRNPVVKQDLNIYDAVVIDPPRAGAKEQAQQLAMCDVPHIAMVSCSPTTFARDARILHDGGYRMEKLQVVDQFIWSAHLEMVGIFRR